MDFLRYLSAVLRQWVAIVTGGAVSVMALILGTFAKFQPTPYVVLGVFIVGLFAAFYLAWRDEYLRGLALAEQRTALEVENGALQAKVDLLQAQARADFQLDINELTFAELSDRGRPVSAVMLLVTLTNRGAESVTTFWALTAKMPGGAPLSGALTVIPLGKVTGVHPDGRQEAVLHEDWLPLRTQKEPVARGKSEQGRVMYMFESVPLASLQSDGTIFELTTRDVWGRSYTASVSHDPSASYTPQEFLGFRPRFYSPLAKAGQKRARRKRS